MHQFIVYAKLTIIVVIALGVVTIVFMNRNHTATFWPGASDQPVSTLWLMLATGVASVAAFWILAKTRRVWKELRALGERKAAEARRAEVERRQRELDAQERRIDEKIKKAL